MMNLQKHTHPVSETVFRTVYDSPAALPKDAINHRGVGTSQNLVMC